MERDWGKFPVIPVQVIRERMAALPGPPMPKNATIGVRAANLGLHRPSGSVGRPREYANDPILPDEAYDPIPADMTRVRRAAAWHGVRFRGWDDLPAVNEAREAKGMATFKRDFGKKNR